MRIKVKNVGFFLVVVRVFMSGHGWELIKIGLPLVHVVCFKTKRVGRCANVVDLVQ